MQNVQVPVWVAVVVTLGVALLGALGPITAQFVNAWRESKKLAREEFYRRMALWRERRLELYGEAVDFAHKSAQYSGMAAYASNAEDRFRNIEKALDLHEKFLKLRPRMLMFSTKEAYRAYQNVADYLEAIPDEVAEAATENPHPDAVEIMREDAQTMHREVGNLITVLREELGISRWI